MSNTPDRNDRLVPAASPFEEELVFSEQETLRAREGLEYRMRALADESPFLQAFVEEQPLDAPLAEETALPAFAEDEDLTAEFEVEEDWEATAPWQPEYEPEMDTEADEAETPEVIDEADEYGEDEFYAEEESADWQDAEDGEVDWEEEEGGEYGLDDQELEADLRLDDVEEVETAVSDIDTVIDGEWQEEYEAKPTRIITYPEVNDKNFSVPAQESLMRMSKSPARNAAAVGLLEAVKGHRLAGIHCANRKIIAERSKRFGKEWWTVIPKGEDAVLILSDPVNPLIVRKEPSEAPLIAFRRELDRRPNKGCGKLKDNEPSTHFPEKIDAALVKAWKTFQLWQAGQIGRCPPGSSGAITNLIPEGFCNVGSVVVPPSPPIEPVSQITYSLHADYDRDGKLSANPKEHARRKQWPGVVITPNLDRDGTRLPEKVTCGSTQTLDVSLVQKSNQDNDLIPIAVIADSKPSQDHTVQLRLSVDDAKRVNICDDSRHLMKGTSRGGFVVYPIGFQSGNRVNLFLEAVTFNASPRFPLKSGSSLSIAMQLDVFDRTEKLIGRDDGLASVSPLLLIGDTSPAERLYMCDIPGDPATLSTNDPSVKDVRAVMLTYPKVKFIRIPIEINREDSWIQDQFQVGYSQRANAVEKVIFHLPRLRSDARLATKDKSLICMISDHFPSSNLGIFNDFFTRVMRIRDIDRGERHIRFEDTVELYALFNKVIDMDIYLRRICLELGRKYPPQPSDIATIIRELDKFKENVTESLDNAIRNTKDDDKKQSWENTKKDIEKRVPAVLRDIFFRNDLDGALVARTTNLSVALEPRNVDKIYRDLAQWHSSHNYGGNILVTPPVPTAPLGKIVVGHSPRSNGDIIGDIDPRLLNFLRMQQAQPVVQVDVSWLRVGHADEIVSFGRVQKNNSSFPVILASPQKALQILQEAFKLNVSDIPRTDRQNVELDKLHTFNRLHSHSARGPHPVTALLRGKQWLQKWPPNEFPQILPPEIYRKIVGHYSPIGNNVRYYQVPYKDDHYYPARLYLREMYYFGSRANERAQEKINEVRAILFKELRMPVIEIPVLFDDYDPEKPWLEKTMAFLPNMVNFQIVDNYLLIPRPYGPRMSPQDAVSVLRNVLHPTHHRYLNTSYFSLKGLNKTWHWAIETFPQLRINTGLPREAIDERLSREYVRVNLDWLAMEFEDGFFPLKDKEKIKRQIKNKNPRKFLPDGTLQPGFHRLEIPENKVDLFEAYTQIMFEGTGLELKWVDSWFYHLRGGGIHCGTNVIRTPPASIPWWEVKPGSGPGDLVASRNKK